MARRKSTDDNQKMDDREKRSKTHSHSEVKTQQKMNYKGLTIAKHKIETANLIHDKRPTTDKNNRKEDQLEHNWDQTTKKPTRENAKNVNRIIEQVD